MNDALDRLIGQVLASRYRIEARIGSGATGTVFRARHVKVNRLFAIKVLHPRFTRDAKLAKRFDREAQIAGTLSHPNVISVVDASDHDGLRYLVMEYAEGVSLGQLMVEAPMPAPRVLRIAQQLCDGLQHAHERKLIHRDFKPDNVIVERSHGREVARIVDFGIAILGDNQSSSEQERLTTAGMILGTPHYMAPEHARGGAIDHRIDLFALGMILYEMLAGRMPFDGDGVDVARANLSSPTPAMSVRVPNLEVDPLLEAFTRKLLMKSPNRRPPTALAARQLLDLIAVDRAAAATALGVDPEFDDLLGKVRKPRSATATPNPAASEPPRRVVEALPETTKCLSEWAADTTAVAEADVKTRSRRRHALAGALVAVMTLAIGFVATRRSAIEQSQVDIAAMPSPEPVAAREHITAHETVTVPRETVGEPAPPPGKPAIAKQVPARSVTTPDEIVADPAPTPQALADLYIAVGRQLRQLSLDMPDADPLWTRYRRIKLHDAMATSDARRAASRTLAELRTKIVSR